MILVLEQYDECVFLNKLRWEIVIDKLLINLIDIIFYYTLYFYNYQNVYVRLNL